MIDFFFPNKEKEKSFLYTVPRNKISSILREETYYDYWCTKRD